MKEIKLINGEIAKLIDTKEKKILKSTDYNFYFDKRSGFFARYGKSSEDDGELSLGLPEIADIEISTSCHGVGKPCQFCYKSNTPDGKYMNFDTFKKIFHKLPPSITQIAAGIGDIDSNPDMWKIFGYCRDNGVIPNVTINCARMTPEFFDNLVKYCGAVACSFYNKNLTYNAIDELTKRGLTQTNIHFMLHQGSFDSAMQTLKDIQNEPRLQKLNAIVFLSLKTKGNAENGFVQLSQDKFTELVKYGLDNGISLGFDSCGSAKFLKSIEGYPNYKQMETFVEKCESSIYSSYISVDGNYYPCSFCENIEGWEEGLSVLDCNDFLQDIWLNEKTLNFKDKLLSCNRDCPIYKI